MLASNNNSNTFSALLVILLALITALDAMAIDLYLPAMPTIANDLNVTSNDIQLTLSVFLIGLAIGQGIYGPLLDRYGRRTPLLVGIGIFILGSFIATIAQNLEWLLIARLVQAVGAAAGLVTPRAIVDDACSLKESSTIFSLLMQIMMIAPILAPIIGGFLLGHIGWRSIFGFMTLLGGILLIWSYRSIPDTLPIDKRSPLSIKNSVRAYINQIRNVTYMGYMLSGGIILASLFVYISGSSFIFTTYFRFKTGINDLPLSDNIYSTLGGISGYAIRIINSSFSSSFKLKLRVLYDIVPTQRCNSLNLITGLYVASQYKMIILYLPFITESVYPKPV